MANDEVVLLSSEIEELICVHYAPQEQPVVRDMLLSYAASWPYAVLDRVLFDLLYMGAGDPDRLQRLVDVAKRDPRDIMTGEYFWRAGKLYPHEWARRHPANCKYSEPPKPNTTVLAIAELFHRAKPTAPSGSQEQRIPRGKPQMLPSLFLSFSDVIQLKIFADQLLCLAVPAGTLDLTEILRYLGRKSPESTILICMSGKEQETLIQDGEKLCWQGDADYWRECHFKCLQLAESADGFRDMIGVGKENQTVRVSLNTLVSRWT